jgi:hypothetical protein
MSVGQLFIILAAVLFFLAGVGVSAIPNGVTWGFFCLALGMLTSGIPIWRSP